MPKISVIIPCFNQGQYIDEAVDSVLNQTFQDFEIIVINDGSTDAFTINKLKSYIKPKCRVIHTDNQGLAEARNNGIKASSGKYILPLDADDKIGPKYLEEASEILDEQDETGIVYCEAEYFGDKHGRWDLPDYNIDQMLIMNMIFCCAMFRKEDFLKTAGFNPNMKYGWEDWDFWLSLIELGRSVYKLPDVDFYYRIRNSDSMIENLKTDPEKKDYSYKTIYLNHVDFFISNMGHPIELSVRLNSLLNSREYKTGKSIINSMRSIKKLLNGLQFYRQSK